jgi:Uncharacterised protein family (UPF0239)
VTPDDFMDTLLKIGLYLGAVFQLICIAAVIVVPEKLTDSSVKVRDIFTYNLSSASTCQRAAFTTYSMTKRADESDLLLLLLKIANLFPS